MLINNKNMNLIVWILIIMIINSIPFTRYWLYIVYLKQPTLIECGGWIKMTPKHSQWSFYIIYYKTK